MLVPPSKSKTSLDNGTPGKMRAEVPKGFALPSREENSSSTSVSPSPHRRHSFISPNRTPNRTPRSPCDPGESPGCEETPLRRKSRRIASTLLESLLPEAERTLECGEEDMDQGMVVEPSYKSFARGPDRFRLCVRRKRQGPDSSFRLVDRGAAFGQSRGHWLIKNVTVRRRAEDVVSTHTTHGWSALLLEDAYHTFLDAKLRVQLLAFAFVYVFCFCMFGVCYMGMAGKCGLRIEDNFIHAYLLSLETMMTIGYGVTDPYFHGCWEAPVVLTLQSLLNLLISACLIGVIFQGLSRPQSRASTILFSEKAVLQNIGDDYCLTFRVCDMRVQHALIEPHIRCYAMMLGEEGPTLIPLRLEQPSDELGAQLLLTLPSIVVHRIDRTSPLAPKWMQSSGTRCADCSCPTCGEDFPSVEKLKLHCEYLAAADPASGLPADRCHRELDKKELAALAPRGSPSRDEIEEHLREEYVEVVALLEGIEPTTSSTLQARHSYVVGGSEKRDTEWDMQWAQCCMMRRDDNPGIALDLSRFHALEDPNGSRLRAGLPEDACMPCTILTPG